ncbi:hypothetical protein D3C80_1888070 [compost metagenome]
MGLLQVLETVQQLQVQGAVDMAPGPFAGGPHVNEDRPALVQVAGLQHVDRHRALYFQGGFLGMQQRHQAEKQDGK